jgi:hypothetical protein
MEIKLILLSASQTIILLAFVKAEKGFWQVAPGETLFCLVLGALTEIDYIPDRNDWGVVGALPGNNEGGSLKLDTFKSFRWEIAHPPGWTLIFVRLVWQL